MMGIDNAQNLATVDIPKLLLTTQFDTQQVANWIDQAILYVKVGDNIDRFREAKINTFHEFQRTMDSLILENSLDQRTNSDEGSKLSSLATVLGLASTFELNRLREYSNFPNYTHLDSFYEGSGRLGSLRAEESVQKLTGIGVIDRDWSSVVDNAEEKENLEKEANSLLRKLNGRAKDPSLYTKLGIVYYQQRKSELALAQFDKAIRLNNKFDEAFFGRSIVNLALDELEMAINDISRVIELNPANAQAFNHRGEIYLNSRFYDRAIEDLNKALERDPSLAVAYNNRGVLYNAQGMFNKAISEFEYAKLLGYRQAGLWLIWGLALIQLGEYREAIKKLSVAITKNHRLGDAYGNRGKAYIELGEAFFGQAKKDLDTAISIAREKGEEGKGWALDNDLGMLEFKKGNFRNSISHFETAVEKHKRLTEKEYFWSRVNLAMAFYNLGELENAIKQFQVLRQITKERSLDSTEQDRYNYFAGLIKLTDEEFEKLQKVLETNRQFEDPRGIALALVHLAEFKRKRGDRDEALNDLNEALGIYTQLGAEKEMGEVQQQIERIKPTSN
jgi:tetratricopeptide (TPR) repeat protein